MSQAKPPSVVILTWVAAYNSLQGLIRHFGSAWRRAGLTVFMVDVNDHAGRARVVTETTVQFVMCAGVVDLDFTAERGGFWQRLGIPVYCLHFDHPAYWADRHRNVP